MNNISETIDQLADGHNISGEDAADAFRAIMDGGLTPAQTAAFLVSLRAKGESPEELAGAARAMISRARTISLAAKNTVDLCGTGGDSKGTFNISTAASFITAGAGVAVAKHGNRSVSSPVGSADVLEAAGVNINMNPETAEKCLREAGITFLFAPVFHPSMKNVAPVRKELGVRTAFNILGPLANPALVKRQLIGVPSTAMMDKMIYVAKRLGMSRCMVVTGHGGTDEITPSGETRVRELLEDGSVKNRAVNPVRFGIKPHAPEELAGGGNAAANAEILKTVISGKGGEAKTDAALLNAAAAIYISGAAADMEGGLRAARESLESGAAVEKLNALVKLSAG